MGQVFFHLPDNTIFHGIAGNPSGFTFQEARIITDDNIKIEKLRTRLEAYYIEALKNTSHPFLSSILTCVGVEVLGQVIFGFNAKGETIESNTIEVYKMLDSQISNSLSDNFKISYNNNRNEAGESNDFLSSFNCYAHIIRKGLRNSFTHSYRSLGVLLDDSQSTLMKVDENEGIIIINPEKFRDSYITTFNKCFDNILNGNEPNYKSEALKYFDLLIK